MSFNLPGASRFSHFPEIRRARGFHLYGADGRRYLNMYLDGGRELSGSRPAGMGQRFKASLDKLGVISCGTAWPRRFEKLLLKQFPRYSHAALLSPLDFYRFTASASGEVWDPWDVGYGLSAPARAAVSLWRPWLDSPEADILVPVIPGAGTWGAVPVLSAKPLDFDSAPVAPFLLAPQLFAAGMLFEEVKERESSGFERITGPWRQLGPYLYPLGEEKRYHQVTVELLSCGIYPSPDFYTPSIVPGEFSEGELRSLKKKENVWDRIC